MPVKDQGIFKDRYTIIPRVLVFAVRGESVLLIKGSPNKRIWPNLYNGVGGHIEAGEDPLTAARREFQEETGLRLLSEKLSAVVLIDTGKIPGIGMYVFLGETEKRNPIASSEGDLEWIPISEINSFPLVEDLSFLIPTIIKQGQDSQTIFLQYRYDSNGQLLIEGIS